MTWYFGYSIYNPDAAPVATAEVEGGMALIYATHYYVTPYEDFDEFRSAVRLKVLDICSSYLNDIEPEDQYNLFNSLSAMTSWTPTVLENYLNPTEDKASLTIHAGPVLFLVSLVSPDTMGKDRKPHITYEFTGVNQNGSTDAV